MRKNLVFGGSLFIAVSAATSLSVATAQTQNCLEAAKVVTEAGKSSSGNEDMYREAVKLCPAMAEAHYNLGVMLLRKGQPQQAVEELSKALELKDSFEIRLSLAIARMKAGDIDSARIDLMSLVEKNPDNVKAAQALAVLHEKDGKLMEARDVLFKAREKDPRNIITLFNLGAIYLKMGDRDGALDLWQKALEINPSHIPSLVSLGHAWLDAGNDAEALKYLEKAASTGAGLEGFSAADINREVGLIYQRQHDLEKSELALRRAVRANEKDFGATLSLAGVLIEKKQEAQALELAERALSVKPDDTTALLIKGRALVALGKLDAAGETFKMVLERDGGNVAAMKALSSLYQKQGRKEEARSYSDMASRAGG